MARRAAGRTRRYDVVRSVIAALDQGEIRVAEVVDGDVVVNEAAKHAILMWFRVNDMAVDRGRPVRVRRQAAAQARATQQAGVRVVPGALGALRLVPGADAS